MADWNAMSDEEKAVICDVFKEKLVHHFEALMAKDLVALMKQADENRLEASHG